MTAKEAIKYLGLEQYQVIKEMPTGFKVEISFSDMSSAKQYIANREDTKGYYIFTMVIKDIDLL